jgi:hypothetical protein
LRVCVCVCVPYVRVCMRVRPSVRVCAVCAYARVSVCVRVICARVCACERVSACVRVCKRVCERVFVAFSPTIFRFLASSRHFTNPFQDFTGFWFPQTVCITHRHPIPHPTQPNTHTPPSPRSTPDLVFLPVWSGCLSLFVDFSFFLLFYQETIKFHHFPRYST